MNYRIEKRDAFQVFWIRGYIQYRQYCEPTRSIDPGGLAKHMQEWRVDKLRQSVIGDWWREGNFSKELGAVFAYDSYKFTSNTTFPYLIGCYKSENSKVDGYTVVDVPASTWAAGLYP
ncbi:hypothetical protein [Paenibacillus sp. GCM10027626]|uniref:hypothetical protein n=1 Tax=Paenibacillus sp. GCM10027626 TaxID=3273411 RepID=UPI00363E4DAF